ncbi:hypothetical protein D2T29_08500 [Sinirhodobacter populi]|uniref:DUF6455 domain-containing protein n=1 Tax=Paenirhodobacter populi TaxID=2306993 RepID=A0A443KHJ3_9RHOB|nr:DUF6455 family protein [Sinirhodobacter populi]RWR32225.1 hypothetical protein D2T29_08500 [Sinirhodobacter populi]
MFEVRTVHSHAALMNRVAAMQGVDMAGALRSGGLSGVAWRDAVMACLRCPAPHKCRHRLAAALRPGADPALAELPAFCANRALIEALMPAQQEERAWA